MTSQTSTLLPRVFPRRLRKRSQFGRIVGHISDFLPQTRIATRSSTYIDSGFAYFSGVPSNPLPGQGNPGFAPYGTVPVPISSIVKRVESNLPIELVADNTFEITLGSVPMAYMFSLSWYSPTNGTWRAPAATLTNATFVNSGTTGSYQTVKIPNNAAGTSGVNGAQSTYFVKTPAATLAIQHLVS